MIPIQPGTPFRVPLEKKRLFGLLFDRSTNDVRWYGCGTILVFLGSLKNSIGQTCFVFMDDKGAIGYEGFSGEWERIYYRISTNAELAEFIRMIGLEPTP